MVHKMCSICNDVLFPPCMHDSDGVWHCAWSNPIQGFSTRFPLTGMCSMLLPYVPEGQAGGISGLEPPPFVHLNKTCNNNNKPTTPREMCEPSRTKHCMKQIDDTGIIHHPMWTTTQLLCNSWRFLTLSWYTQQFGGQGQGHTLLHIPLSPAQ